MLLAAVGAGVIIGSVRRGPGRYGRPRAIGLVIAAALLQVGAQSLSGAVHTLTLAVSLGLAALWLVVQRRHLASLLLAAGAALNLAVITANGGMPVDPTALAAVGRRGI